MQNKKTLFSGMKPSGMPTLGNYLGAFKNWEVLQEKYDCIYCIADLHTITVRQNPKEFRQNIKNLFALYIAIGLDDEKNTLFIQSHVPAHSELNWILGCYAYMGELSRMTQFKDKSKNEGKNISTGLFNYPTLQTADILLYQADLVPVGEDQRQHLELARDIATRFNNTYSETFTIPEIYIPKIGAKIMGLQYPNKKMSKSEGNNENNVIYLLDDLKIIANKIKKSVTDSDEEIAYKSGKDGINNLLNIYCAITKKDVKNIEKEFIGLGYGAFKGLVAEAVVEEIRPIQEKFNRLIKDKEHIENCMKKGAEKANYIANKTLRKVKKKIGFI